jgi:hypothetical protein
VTDNSLPARLAAVGALVARAPERPEVLSHRTDRLVVRVGDVVVKAHAVGTAVDALSARLRIAADPLLAELLLAPLPIPPSGAAPHVPGTGGLAVSTAGRLVTVWPLGEPLSQDDPDAAPWRPAAAMLARLHAIPVEELRPFPAAGGPDRLGRAISALRGLRPTAATHAVLRAFAGLPPADPSGNVLVHGDWHFGQLVRVPEAGWRMVDIDDLGASDPAWDLGRPAAWFAAGLLPPEQWDAFLEAYRAAGGVGVPASGDPWPRLDVPARMLTVQAAAQAVVTAAEEGRPLDDVDEALVDACVRMVGIVEANG